MSILVIYLIFHLCCMAYIYIVLGIFNYETPKDEDIMILVLAPVILAGMFIGLIKERIKK